MEVFILFSHHLLHWCVNELGAESTYDSKKTKCPITTMTYQHVGKVKTKKGWSVEIECGLEETPLFLST